MIVVVLLTGCGWVDLLIRSEGAMAAPLGETLRGCGGRGGGLTGVVAFCGDCERGGGNATVSPAAPLTDPR